jgi:hypothetical protein
MNACISSRRGESGRSSLTHPDPRKPRESANDPSPALAGTLSPSEGERDRVRGPALGPRLFPIPTRGSGVVSLLKSGRRPEEALISAAFAKEFEPPHVRVAQAVCLFEGGAPYSQGAVEFGYSGLVNPKGCQRVAGGRRPPTPGDLRVTMRKMSCNPEGC